jgi:hypothetical protein
VKLTGAPMKLATASVSRKTAIVKLTGATIQVHRLVHQLDTCVLLADA